MANMVYGAPTAHAQNRVVVVLKREHVTATTLHQHMVASHAMDPHQKQEIATPTVVPVWLSQSNKIPLTLILTSFDDNFCFKLKTHLFSSSPTFSCSCKNSSRAQTCFQTYSIYLEF